MKMKSSNVFDVINNLVTQVNTWKESDQAEELIETVNKLGQQVQEGKLDYLKHREIKPTDLFK
jgi:gas vesicle protein